MSRLEKSCDCPDFVADDVEGGEGGGEADRGDRYERTCRKFGRLAGKLVLLGCASSG